jgi:hypothetical protein
MPCNCGGNHLTETDCPTETENPCGDCGLQPTRTTYCDRDIVDNVWMERDGNLPDAPGICLLDTMDECQIIDVVSRQPRARADLLRVTSDPHLRELAVTTPQLGTDESEDKEMSDINRNSESIPFYTIFRGQPPFAQ